MGKQSAIWLEKTLVILFFKARILLVCKLVSKQGVSVIQCKRPTDLKSKGIEKYNIL